MKLFKKSTGTILAILTALGPLTPFQALAAQNFQSAPRVRAETRGKMQLSTRAATLSFASMRNLTPMTSKLGAMALYQPLQARPAARKSPVQLPAGKSALPAQEKLLEAQTLMASPSSSGGSSASNSNDRSAADSKRYWDGSKTVARQDQVGSVLGGESKNLLSLSAPQPGSNDSSPVPPLSFSPAAVQEKGKLGKTVGMGIIGMAMTKMDFTQFGGFFLDAKPYVSLAGLTVGIYSLNRVVESVVEKAARRWNWNPNTTVRVKLAATGLTMALTVPAGLHMIGISSSALLTSLGVSGIAVTVASREFIGNFIEAVRLLIFQPFKMGERVKLGNSIITAEDMDLRYLKVTRDGYSVPTYMPYTAVADRTITRFETYAANARQSLRPALSFSERLGLINKPSLKAFGKSAFWAFMAVATLPVLPMLSAHLPIEGLSALMPWIKAGGILLTTHAVEKAVTDLVVLLSQMFQWNRQSSTVIKLFSQMAVYAFGGDKAMGAAGMKISNFLFNPTAQVLAGGWALSLLVAVRDTLSNLMAGISTVLMSKKVRIGKSIQIGVPELGLRGTVIDMNYNYVILQNENNSHILVPYSIIKVSEITPL